MAKKLYLVTLLVICMSISSAFGATATCPTQTCAAAGGSCNKQFGNETTIAFCPAIQYCNMSDNGNLCLNRIPLNGACDPNQGNPCATSSTVSCQSTNSSDPSAGYTCQPSAVTKYPGESCTGTDLCFFYSPTSSATNCTNGQCFGIGVGGPCTPDFIECVVGAFCSTSNICTAVKSNGQICADDSECSSGFCIPTNADGTSAQCNKANAVVSGGFCSETQHCGEGLWCNLGTSTVGTCQNALTSSNTPCDPSNSNCTSPETCVCLYTGNSVCQAPTPSQLTGTANAQQDLTNCLTNNACTGDACQFTNCIEETCALISLTFSTSPGIDWRQQVLALPCRYTDQQVSLANMCMNPHNPAPTSSSSTIVASVALVIASVSAMLL